MKKVPGIVWICFICCFCIPLGLYVQETFANQEKEKPQVIKVIDQEAIEKEKEKFRETYDEVLEASFKKEGYRIIVISLGDHSDVLSLSYIFFDESWIKKFDQYNCFSLWKTLGYKKVFMRDGAGLNREISLKNYPTIILEENNGTNDR